MSFVKRYFKEVVTSSKLVTKVITNSYKILPLNTYLSNYFKLNPNLTGTSFVNNKIEPKSGDRVYICILDVPDNTYASFTLSNNTQVGLVQNNSGGSITTTISLPVPDEDTLTYAYGGSGTPTIRSVMEMLINSATR